MQEGVRYDVNFSLPLFFAPLVPWHRGAPQGGKIAGRATEWMDFGDNMAEISILDLARIGEDADAGAALRRARDLAAHAEQWGYSRFWVAEHHNMRGIASSATAVVIGYIAAGTRRIRIGAGGVMLPNHSPLVIAEQFGTLASLYPGRIDLGLGRAPGTDQATLRALRRHPAAADRFPEDVLELQALLGPARTGQSLFAVPGVGTEVPLWILGSSTFGARLAAELGLPFGFASHFAPEYLLMALDIYRSNFRPSQQLARPHAMVGVNIIAAATDEQARRLATTQQMSSTNQLRGTRGLSQPPIDDIHTYWTADEARRVRQKLARSIVGTRDTVAEGIAQLLNETLADELMIVSDVYEFEHRLRSYELISQAHAMVAGV